MTRTIIFVSHTGEISGAELVMLQLMRLAHEQGFTVTLACPEGPLRDRARASVDFETVTLPTLSLRGEGGLARVLAILEVAKNWRIAGRIIASRAQSASSTVIVNSLFALPVIRLGRVPQRATWLVHDTLSSTKQRIVVRIAKPGIRRAVAVSGPTSLPVLSLGIPTSVSRLGVVVPPEVTEVRSPARRVVGIIGSLTPWKGHLVLMDAIARTVDVQLEIAGLPFPGDEMYAQVLRERAQQSDLAGRVTFLGYVDSLATIKRWDIAISASTSPEAGPLVALEAMSIGVPVVGTDLGGTSELLGDGAGSLVEPSDSVELAAEITRLLEDGSARSELSRIGRRKVEDRYDIQKNLPALLKELIDG
ncbi:glycosyltransferase family 4 protein [Rhodococcus erythropolis]|nr:glycosyltransferase family 4 protein [Rhodococcus erythropolis]AGT93848.1 glycosyltransferase [Rhodococcus erythropolis CCM2595]ORI26358.1 hypothetical protein BH686_20105 [Rhodococcus erythropolis]BAH35001.1 putative glycosyltransferase [Rhodococcus erythropolis PR4]SUE11798.1 glycosyltransferase [Rhodococcus erythropolis]